MNVSLLRLEEELESSRDQGEQWRTELEDTTQKLHNTTEELVSLKRNEILINESLPEIYHVLTV